MAFANNMALQVDAPAGVVRMVFIEARGPVNMPDVYNEVSVQSRVVGDIAMPVNMAREIVGMLQKALELHAPAPNDGAPRG